MVALDVVSDLSRETVRQVLGEDALKPHRRRMWCIPPQPSAEFVRRMEDVLDVHCRSADPRRPVACLDALSTQPVGEVRTPLPVRPGQAARHDRECVRHGTADPFMAFGPLGGWRGVQVTERRWRGDWAHLVRGLGDGRHKDAGKVVPVMDQPNIPSPASLCEALPPAKARRIADKLEIHHTPKHGSWLNMAEIELSVFRRDLPECGARQGDAGAPCRRVAAPTQHRHHQSRVALHHR